MISDQGTSSLLKTRFTLTGGQSQANVNNLTVFLGNGYPSANFGLNKFSASRNNATPSDNSNNWFNQTAIKDGMSVDFKVRRINGRLAFVGFDYQKFTSNR